MKKIENNKLFIENKIKEINNTIEINANDLMKKMENNKLSIENQIQEINNTIKINSDDLMKKSENNKISIENHVDDLSDQIQTLDWHSLDVVSKKIIMCGGAATWTSCLEFLPTSSTGSWVNYTTLAQGRYAHTSHVFKDDLLLLGGDVSKGTTEIIGKGTQYNLQQDT